ncbi:MAG: hypothetical protein N2050_03485 [Flavobacteriales bacterium]|nr:hypothetical protein [Flavobacteriales bacterium]
MGAVKSLKINFRSAQLKAAVLTILWVPGIIAYNTRSANGFFADGSLPRVITWDNFGYFLWLPAFFIHGDPWLRGAWVKEAFEKYQPSGTLYQVYEGPQGLKASIYHPGMALLSLPAFGTGHLLAKLSGFPSDGFSAPYRWSYLVWFLGLMYLAFLWILKAWEVLFPDIDGLLFILGFIGLSNVPATFGLYGVSVHTAGFAFSSGLLLLWARSRTSGWNTRKCIGLALWAGLALLTRPPLVLWSGLVAPGLFEYFKKSPFRRLLHLAALSISAGLPLLLLMNHWHSVSGRFTLNLHREVFDWAHPRWQWFLFSARNGWLVYSPAFFFLLPGWYFWFRRQRSEALWGAGILLALLWLHSAWECWHYGGGYGQRTMTDYYPFLMLPMAFGWEALQKAKPWAKKALRMGITSLIFLNIFQTVQTFTGALTARRNTWPYYFCQFLRLFPCSQCAPLLYQEPPETLGSLEDLNGLAYDSATMYRWQAPDGDTNFIQGREFSVPGLHQSFLSLSDRDHLLLFVRTRMVPLDTLSSPILAVGYLESKGRMLLYQAPPLRPNSINPEVYEAALVIAENFSPEDSVRVYLWNKSRKKWKIQEVRIVKALPRQPASYIIR